MSGIALATTVIGAGASMYSAKQASKGRGGEYPTAPDYREDPDYIETQAYLKNFGMNTLKGEIDPYYRAIGETGSKEFEGMLKNTNRDITRSTTEALAKGGRARGGQLAASTAQAIGDSSVQARYEDYARSLEGKRFLMNEGVNAVTGVRDAAMGENQNQNAFALDKYGHEVNQYEYEQQRLDDEAAARGEMYGSIAGMGTNLLSQFGTSTKKTTTAPLQATSVRRIQ
jgi:hypothetical protein